MASFNFRIFASTLKPNWSNLKEAAMLFSFVRYSWSKFVFSSLRFYHVSSSRNDLQLIQESRPVLPQHRFRAFSRFPTHLFLSNMYEAFRKGNFGRSIMHVCLAAVKKGNAIQTCFFE